MNHQQSRRFATAVVAALAAVAARPGGVPALGQEARAGAELSGQPVVAIEFAGLRHTSEVFARDIVGMKPGDRARTAALDEAVSRLLRTGRFLAVEYALEPAADGVRVRFSVRERPVVTAVRVEGNSHFRSGRLLKVVDQKTGETLDLFAVRDAREAMIAMYRDDGFGDVEVTFDEALVAQTGELIFKIVEGPQIVVRKITFEGNASLPADKLRKQIETKTALWFFRKGALDKDLVEGDVARLRNFYRDEGFLDAEVAFHTAVDPDGDLTLTFTVTEGVCYRIESVGFRGPSAFSENELRAVITSREGEIVKRPTVDSDAKAIQTRYGEFGYIYAAVRALRVFSETPGLVRITFQVDEGGQFRVGRVAVRGNTRTRDKVVRRALNLYPPDDLFNLTEAKEAERRLMDTRIFSSARVLPVGNQPDVRDAVIDVVESPKAGDFIFGAGVTSNSGLVGSIVLDLHNFDLWDTPQSWSEFFKFRSFYGGGQRMRIELQPGSEVGRYRVDFTEPYLFDRPLRFDLGLYLYTRERDGYDETRIGSTASLGKRFERGLLRGWSGEVALRAENVKIDDLDLFVSREVREDEGDNLLTSVKGSLVRDRTDNRFIPTTGDRLSLSYEQFYGDHVFGKVNLGYDWYTTLSTDRLDRKHVLAVRGDTGYILGRAPVFERYFAGGTGSVRGFEFRGIGERDGLDDTNVGGDFLVLVSTEYSYPLYGDNLRGHVFLDTGTAGSGTYRAAVGTGIRFTLNLLGPFPIELNVALPVSEDEDDETQAFSFIIGGAFGS